VTLTLLLFLAAALLALGVGSVTRTLTVGYSGSNPPVSTRDDVDGNAESLLALHSADGTGLAASASNVEHDLTLTRANLKLLVVRVSGGNGSVTVKVNSSSAPDETFTFAGGSGVIVWDARGGTANPFSADVTKLFLSNAGTTVADVDFRALYT